MNLLFLKRLKLTNYCQYENNTFDFAKPNGEPFKFICFFGPNGVGKSNLLNAIALLSMNTQGRGDMFVQQSLRKYITNPDLDPTWQNVSQKDNSVNMLIEGTYEMDGKEYIVQLSQDGYIRNDFAPIASSNIEDMDEIKKIQNNGPWGKKHLAYRQRICHFIKSDFELSMHRIQIHISQKKKFEKIISEITRFPTKCVEPKGLNEYEKDFCTDFIMTKEKKGKTYHAHFKSMSAGEKKICKSFSDLLNLMRTLEHPISGENSMPGWPRILLMDNIDLHVYYDRHITMVEKMKEVFHKQQIFSTTHSGVLIPRYLRGENDSKEELMINLEKI